MGGRILKLTGCFILVLLIGATSISVKAQKNGPLPDLAQLDGMASRFAPTPLRVDTSRLSSGDRQALVKLIEAARVLNDIFMPLCPVTERHDAARQSTAALFLDQQGSVVRP
jgi:hypothetical protein